MVAPISFPNQKSKNSSELAEQPKSIFLIAVIIFTAIIAGIGTIFFVTMPKSIDSEILVSQLTEHGAFFEAKRNFEGQWREINSNESLPIDTLSRITIQLDEHTGEFQEHWLLRMPKLEMRWHGKSTEPIRLFSTWEDRVQSYTLLGEHGKMWRRVIIDGKIPDGFSGFYERVFDDTVPI